MPFMSSLFIMFIKCTDELIGDTYLNFINLHSKRFKKILLSRMFLHFIPFSEKSDQEIPFSIFAPLCSF